VVLVDGELAGTWRARLQRRRLVLTVEPFGALSRATRGEIEAEAELLSDSRGAQSAEVVVAG
jgi:hypothetical protein